MDQNLRHRRRYQLNLGKFPVIEVTPNESNQTIVIDMQNRMFIRMAAPLTADVRIGDLLTLYTEVLARELH
jgi:hypothetical protein